MAHENKEHKLRHLFDGSEWNVYEGNILNLGVGAPGEDLLQNCCDIFQKATEHRLLYERECNGAMLFQYGPSSGVYEVRAAIAKYFSEIYDDVVKAEDLFITTGATQGLHLILSTLIDLNGYVFVDEVTYMIALDSVKQYTTLQLIPVRFNEDGVDLVDLERAVKEKQFTSKTKEFWGIYYTIPAYHNPTGVQFSKAVCEGIIKLARKYDFLTVCDDVYNVLPYYDSKPSKRLFAYDNKTDADYRGNVISNGSFAKIIGPGARLGWLELPARAMTIIEKSGIIQSGGCLNNYTSGILCSLFELGLAQQHIKMMHDAYKSRMLVTCDTLSKELPAECKMIPPRGGYFIWITLPENLNAGEFLKYCLKEEKLYFIPGSRFSLEGKAKNCLRISIAFQSKEKLVYGTTKLCNALKNI